MKYLALIAASLMSFAVAAHHGWSWAEEDQSQLKGTIESISMSPPHPVLKVKAADGVWQVDLGNPNQTERSGFKADSAAVGDSIVVLGNRSLDKTRLHMKAVRITVRDRQFDLYPERIKTN